MNVLFRNGWESDAKPRSPCRTCGLSLINPQNLSRLALLVRTICTSDGRTWLTSFRNCLLSHAIKQNPQAIEKYPRMKFIVPKFTSFLQVCGVVYIAHLVNGGFFYVDTSNQVKYGACFSSGDLFSLCINGMAISVVSVVLAIIFTLKDCIMCGVNSCSVSCLYSIQIYVQSCFMLLHHWCSYATCIYTVVI